jgi:hypothetical protein
VPPARKNITKEKRKKEGGNGKKYVEDDPIRGGKGKEGVRETHEVQPPYR